MILDHDLDFLEKAVAFFDRRIGELEHEADECVDPDDSGYFDQLEYIAGLGFAVCQQYLTVCTSRYGLSKGETLSIGPAHRCGASMASIINAAGNYWKHSSEWSSTESGRRSTTTREALRRLGVDLDREYVLSNVLAAVLGPAPHRFARVVPFIERWRDEARALAAQR